MRFCGPLLISLLLLSLPAMAQVQRNPSDLNSRQRAAGASHRGGWISPETDHEEQEWTVRKQLAVRRAFRSISGNVSSILARRPAPQAGTQTITAVIPAEPAPAFRLQRNVAEDIAALDKPDSLAESERPASMQELEFRADYSQPAEVEEDPSDEQSAVDDETKSADPDSQAEDTLDPPAGKTESAQQSAGGETEADAEPEAVADRTSPSGRDFRIRLDDDGRRLDRDALHFPADDNTVPPAADITTGSASEELVSEGFIPDEPRLADPPLANAARPARLSPASGRLVRPGERSAPLDPLPSSGVSDNYEVRSNLHRISRGNSKLRQVALTFDDGPHPEYTSQLLAVLDYYNAPATFFFVGVQSSKYPQWLQMASQQGHEIASQTYDHFRLPKLPEAEKIYQIDAYQQLVEDLTGSRPRFLRPPGGQLDDETQRLLVERNMVCALWDVALNDTTAGRTSDEMLNHVLGNVRNGSVILAHDGIQATIDLLPELIERLREEGYELVTMSELASGL